MSENRFTTVVSAVRCSNESRNNASTGSRKYGHSIDVSFEMVCYVLKKLETKYASRRIEIDHYRCLLLPIPFLMKDDFD
ncbi:MAG: hypothetical protein EOP04_28645 [Proteobacteria bacterium]|nr:MAG: hypothetical protein EOP04_28645 [Pseudomonadota bacterium]